MSRSAGAVARFRALHAVPELLVLANAWDVLSALLVRETGGKAVATTSAGVAWALGYADGEQLSAERLLGFARDLVRAVARGFLRVAEARRAASERGATGCADRLFDGEKRNADFARPSRARGKSSFDLP